MKKIITKILYYLTKKKFRYILPYGSINSRRYESQTINTIGPGYIALWVDTLNIGGLEQVVALLATNLRQNGIKIKVFCSQNGGQIAEELKQIGVEVIVFNNDKDIFKEYLTKNRPLLISSHYVHSMLDIPQSLNIPVVETIHNMYANYTKRMWRKEKLRNKKFIQMIAVSNMVKTFYEKNINENISNDIIVVGNSIDKKRVKFQKKEDIATILNISNYDYIFLNIASFDGRKNQIGLISSFEMFYNNVDKNAKLILIGNTINTFYKKEIDKYIKNLNSKDNIIILNYISNVGDYLNIANAFVMPSYIEGWSISATEALFAGIPIIHTYCGSGQELCDNGKNGILISNPNGDPFKINRNTLRFSVFNNKPQNTEELYIAMKSMYENRDKWKLEKENIIKRANENYSIDNMINGYIYTFNEVLKNIN